jgi:hypothetical protein
MKGWRGGGCVLCLLSFTSRPNVSDTVRTSRNLVEMLQNANIRAIHALSRNRTVDTLPF